MNVLLHSADGELLAKLKDRQGASRSAILRFADDMYLLSRSASGLVGLIDDVWSALAGDVSAVLASKVSPSNLYLNLGKVDPPELKELVKAYLTEHGWKECKICKELRRPCKSGTSESAPTFASWWRSSRDGRRSSAAALRRTAVGPREVGPFVTTLVARLSDLGTDTLAERFGDEARNRRDRLHELARFDIDDKQVRPETRRTFAVNRLVRVWLPPDHDTASTALSDVRESTAYVLRETPWKFSLWRAVVRAAALRPTGATDEDSSLAVEWLVDRLRHIAHVDVNGDPRSWMNTWPEDAGRLRHQRDPLWKEQYLSYHRAVFWQSLGDVLRELWHHHGRVKRPPVGDAGPPPSWWTLRAIPAGDHTAVAALLGALDKWSDVLYPSDGMSDCLKRWPWELDQLVAAVLASAVRPEVAEGLRRAERPGGTLMVPRSPFGESAPRTMDILAGAERVLRSRERARDLKESGLAHVYLAGRKSSLAPLLSPENEGPRILGTLSDPDRTISIGVALGCVDDIGRDLLKEAAVVDPAAMARRVLREPLALQEYARARRLFLAHEEGTS